MQCYAMLLPIICAVCQPTGKLCSESNFFFFFDVLLSRGWLAGHGYEVALNGKHHVARIIPKRADAIIISAILGYVIWEGDINTKVVHY